MATTIPTKGDLRSRILEHLEARANNQLVTAGWQGYLAALLESGLLEIPDYDELAGLLPARAKTPIVELFLGPEYVDNNPTLKAELLAQETGSVPMNARHPA